MNDLTSSEAADIAGAAEKNRVRGEIDRGDWRRLAERACISLLNSRSLESTAAGWQARYEETQKQLKHMENLLATFQADLTNQRNTMINALKVKYGHGSTTE